MMKPVLKARKPASNLHTCRPDNEIPSANIVQTLAKNLINDKLRKHAQASFKAVHIDAVLNISSCPS